MKITIIGAGYVGLSLATLLSESNEVTILDIKQSKVDQINNRISPIVDKEIDDFFKNKQLNLNATSSEEAYLESKYRDIFENYEPYDLYQELLDRTINKSNKE